MPLMPDPWAIKPLNFLTGIRELLTNPKKWTKDVEARLEDGSHTHATDPKAVCFCLQGAAIKVACPGDSQEHAQAGLKARALTALLQEYRAFNSGPKESVVWMFNDAEGRTHADILKFLDTRIEFHLKAQQPS